MVFTIAVHVCWIGVNSVFKKDGGSQVDSLRFRAETSLDLQDFARGQQRPRADVCLERAKGTMLEEGPMTVLSIV